MQREYLTANGRVFECVDTETRCGYIEMTMENQDADELETFFRGVAELELSFKKPEEKTGSGTAADGGTETDSGAGTQQPVSVPHGIYKNLKYDSYRKHDNGNVTVRMRILTGQEIDTEELKKTQAEQDELIMEMMFGKA